MAIGRTNAGGGTSLNFKVVGGTTQPTAPKENTIWVRTDIDIPYWVFSETAPESPAEGVCWFALVPAATTATKFNAVKKHTLEVSPLYCSQYISGAWESRNAELYEDGEWVVFWQGLMGKGINKLGTPSFLKHYGGDAGAINRTAFGKNSDGTFNLAFGATEKDWVNGVAFFGSAKLSLAGFSRLTIKYRVVSKTIGGAGRLELQVANGSTVAATASVVLVNSGTSTSADITKSVDISSLDNGYLRFYGTYSANDYVRITIQEIVPS